MDWRMELAKRCETELEEMRGFSVRAKIIRGRKTRMPQGTTGGTDHETSSYL